MTPDDQVSGNNNHPALLLVTRAIFLLLGVVWLLLAVWILAGGPVGIEAGSFMWWLIIVGLLGNAGAHWLVSWGLSRRVVPFAVLGGLVLLANALLTAFDETGPLEWVFILLLLGTMVMLGVLIWGKLQSD